MWLSPGALDSSTLPCGLTLLAVCMTRTLTLCTHPTTHSLCGFVLLIFPAYFFPYMALRLRMHPLAHLLSMLLLLLLCPLPLIFCVFSHRPAPSDTLRILPHPAGREGVATLPHHPARSILPLGIWLRGWWCCTCRHAKTLSTPKTHIEAEVCGGHMMLSLLPILIVSLPSSLTVSLLPDFDDTICSRAAWEALNCPSRAKCCFMSVASVMSMLNFLILWPRGG